MKKVTLFLLIFTAAYFSLKAENTFQQYTGKYIFSQGSLFTEINVVIDNGTLQLSSTLGSTVIEKGDTDKFTIPSYNGTAVFVRNEAKKITGIKIEAMGVSLEGTKEEKDVNTNAPVPNYKATFPMKFLPVLQIQEDEEISTSSPHPF